MAATTETGHWCPKCNDERAVGTPSERCFVCGSETEPTVICPKCGKRCGLDGCDMGGADFGNVFCNGCNCEFNPDTGAITLPVDDPA